MIFTDNNHSGRLGLPFRNKKLNKKSGETHKDTTTNGITEATQDMDMNRDDVDYFRNELSSDSRMVEDDDDGFFEYESLSFFNLPRTESPIDIVIAVQASTISSRIAGDDVPIDNLTLDLTSGHAVVGIVREKGSAVNNIRVGDRVATIVNSLTRNPRYAKVSSNIVVKVPCGVDSAEAASCAYTFLRGFQSLNHGVPSHIRYSSRPLQGQSILIIDGTGMTGQATIQLAINAGAEKVYAIGEPLHHEALESSGAIPLNPINWVQIVENKIDLVIDSVEADHYKQSMAGKALKPDGKIVCVGKPITIEGLKTSSISCQAFIEDLFAQLNLVFVEQKKATFYDLFSSLFHYPEMMKVNMLEENNIFCRFDISKSIL